MELHQLLMAQSIRTSARRRLSMISRLVQVHPQHLVQLLCHVSFNCFVHFCEVMCRKLALIHQGRKGVRNGSASFWIFFVIKEGRGRRGARNKKRRAWKCFLKGIEFRSFLLRNEAQKGKKSLLLVVHCCMQRFTPALPPSITVILFAISKCDKLVVRNIC